MDFIEAKHVAAREIALALGVPPMLLGIPGDNTYSNYQEANRSLWRQTILPLATRTAKALSQWLSPAYGAPLELRPDLDAIEALTPEREALWSRVEKATFLTQNEKRAAVGYGPLEESGNDLIRKYRPDQPRIPAGQPGGGQWTNGGGTDASESNPNDSNVILAAGGKRGGIPKALYNWTVQQFFSKYCKGHVKHELPGELKDISIADMLELAKGGDAAAKRCKKLLEQSRFRK
jgi:hypothetical protein